MVSIYTFMLLIYYHCKQKPDKDNIHINTNKYNVEMKYNKITGKGNICTGQQWGDCSIQCNGYKWHYGYKQRQVISVAPALTPALTRVVKHHLFCLMSSCYLFQNSMCLLSTDTSQWRIYFFQQFWCRSLQSLHNKNLRLFPCQRKSM